MQSFKNQQKQPLQTWLALDTPSILFYDLCPIYDTANEHIFSGSKVKAT